MQLPEPPEGFELLGEFVEVSVTATIVGTKFHVEFTVLGEVVPGTAAQQCDELIAAVGTAMMVVWESAWARRKSATLSVQYRCLQQSCTLTADTEQLPIEAVANAARDLVREL